MNLHKVIVHPGIRTSEKFGKVSMLHRDLFYGLLSAAHKGGWFEANAGLLRAALYAPCLGKVSERDIKDGLLKLREVGLIKLWTGKNGRAYGSIINYRQRFNYGEDLPEDGLAPDDELPLDASPEPDPPPAPPPKRIEVSEKAREAGNPHPPQDESTWLQSLAVAHPDIDVRTELRVCLDKYPRAGRRFFEDSWLGNCEAPISGKREESRPEIYEPAGFAAWHLKRYGNAPTKAWSDMTPDAQAYFARKMGEHP